MTIDKPIETTENCRYCLMCRHMCPVGHVKNLETLTPHGWALIVASVKRGLLQWNRGTVDVLYTCADCGNCRAHCVNSQPLPEAIAAARADIVQEKLAPSSVYELHVALEKWKNPYERQAPRPVKGRGETALFVGDEARYLWPKAHEAALALLGAAGVQPVLIGAGRNNGYLASSLGLQQIAKKLATENVEDLKASGARRLFVLTPGDFFTFGQLYEERLGVQWPKDFEMTEVIPFLADKLRAGALGFKSTRTKTASVYMDPTHAVRVEARHAAPRRLIAAVVSNTDRELFWRRERTHPCGNLALQFTQPELADQLTRSRLSDAACIGAQSIITEDPACLYHLHQHASEFGLDVQGLYELLAESIR